MNWLRMTERSLVLILLSVYSECRGCLQRLHFKMDILLLYTNMWVSKKALMELCDNVYMDVMSMHLIISLKGEHDDDNIS